MSNSVDPDEMAQYEPSHLDLCCLQKPIIIACGSKSLLLLPVAVKELKKDNIAEMVLLTLSSPSF